MLRSRAEALRRRLLEVAEDVVNATGVDSGVARRDAAGLPQARLILDEPSTLRLGERVYACVSHLRA
jgi:hypothetical protein